MKALLTYDGSKTSESIFPTTQRLLELVPDLDLHMLMVLNPRAAHDTPSRSIGDPKGAATGTMAVPAPSPRMVETHGEAEERLSRETITEMRDVARSWFAGFEPTFHVEWSRDPAAAITEYAQRIEADVIVMATHGRSGLSHLLAGSVAEAVIRSSGRPVLVQGPPSGGQP